MKAYPYIQQFIACNKPDTSNKMNESKQQTIIALKYILCFGLLVFVSLFKAFAQPEAASVPAKLFAQLQNNKPDINRAKAFFKLGDYYLSKQGATKNDLDSAFIFIKKGEMLAGLLHATDLQHEGMLLNGSAYLVTDDTTHAKLFFIQVINYYRKKNNAKQEAETWLRFGEHVNRSNPPLIKFHTYCYRQAEVIYRKIHLNLEATKMLKEIADDDMVGGKLVDAEKELLEVISEFKALHYTKLHYTYDLLASLARLQGDLRKQLIYSTEVVRSMEATADTANATEFYIGLATTYSSLKMTDKAILYYQKALTFTHSHNYLYQYYFTILNLVNLMVRQHNVTGALMLLQKVTTASPPSVVDDKMFIDEGYGACYTALNQYSKAKPYYLDLVKLSDEAFKRNAISPRDYFVHTMYYMRVLLQDKQFKEADAYVQKLKMLPSSKTTQMGMIDFELVQYKIDSAFKNYLPAIAHFKKYTQLKDSVYNVSKTRQIDAIQYKYETEKKDRALLLQTKNIGALKTSEQIQKKLVQKTVVIRNLVIGGLALVIILLGILYNRYRLKQGSNLLLQKQGKEIDRQNQTLVDLNQKQKTLITEKEWLLREIHHRVKNNLQTSMSLLNMQSAHISNSETLNAIKDSQRRMHAMSLIHQRLYQSENVELIDMAIYINELVAYLAESFGNPANIKFEITVDALSFDVDQAVPIGLIINEAITNAFKYAFPGERKGIINITLKNNSGLNRLIVEDDGIGFEPDHHRTGAKSLGIKLMRGLTDQVQGEFELRSRPGTCIIISFNEVVLFY
jgi:two-component sensor histidine kinase